MSKQQNDTPIVVIICSLIVGSVGAVFMTVRKSDVNASEIKANTSSIKEVKKESKEYFLEIRQELRKINDKLYELHKEKK